MFLFFFFKSRRLVFLNDSSDNFNFSIRKFIVNFFFPIQISYSIKRKSNENLSNILKIVALQKCIYSRGKIIKL